MSYMYVYIGGDDPFSPSFELITNFFIIKDDQTPKPGGGGPLNIIWITYFEYPQTNTQSYNIYYSYTTML